MTTIDFSAQDRTKDFPQKKRIVLSQTQIVQVGVGAVGGACAQGLVRSGAEHLTIIEFDTIETSNIPRQSLFNEHDIGKKKVEVAKEKLHSINTKLVITAKNDKLDADNVKVLLEHADLVLDCTDNNEVRKIIDQYCHEHKTPWIHAAAAGAYGEVSIHTDGNSYKNIIDKKASAGVDKLGVMSLASMMTGMLQASLAVQFLTGNEEHNNKLFRVNAVKCSVEEFLLQK